MHVFEQVVMVDTDDIRHMTDDGQCQGYGKQLRNETAEDPELGLLLQVVTNWWPEKASDIPKSLRGYLSLKDFFAVEDGILVKGQRIMIPEEPYKNCTRLTKE